jgi:hypothetical protein
MFSAKTEGTAAAAKRATRAEANFILQIKKKYASLWTIGECIERCKCEVRKLELFISASVSVLSAHARGAQIGDRRTLLEGKARELRLAPGGKRRGTLDVGLK